MISSAPPAPAWFSIVIAVLPALVTVVLAYSLNKKFQIYDAYIKHQNVEFSRLNVDLSRVSLDYKSAEIRNSSTFRVADALLERYRDLQKDLSALLSLLEFHYENDGPLPSAISEQIFALCNSVSMYLAPIGEFDEEFNVQLGQLKAFSKIGGSYWKSRNGFFVSFKTNCWKLLRAEFERVQESIVSGVLCDRANPTPETIKYS